MIYFIYCKNICKYHNVTQYNYNKYEIKNIVSILMPKVSNLLDKVFLVSFYEVGGR
jgi:hypothetical protein